jgi:YVTN family beta-propeller protein
MVVLASLLFLTPSAAASSPPAAPVAAPAAATPKVLATFPVGKMLANAVVSPDGSRLYVTDALAFDFTTHTYSGGVHVVDTASKRVLASIDVGNGPSDIILNRAGTLAYVLNGAGNTVSVVDLRTRSVTRTLDVPWGPSQIVLNAAETVLYVATNGMTVGLVLLDVQTGRTIANIPGGWNAQTLSLNAAETTAYTVNLTDGQLTVIDLDGPQCRARAPEPDGQPRLLDRGHDGKAPAGGIIHVIDLASNTIVGTAPVGFMGSPIAFEPSGQRANVPAGAQEGTVTLVQMPQQ